MARHNVPIQTHQYLWPAYDSRVQRVIRALQDRPGLRTSQLAAMVQLSPNHVERLFKKQTGTTIGQYSMQLRLRRASELLSTTFRSVKEIRNDVGIPDTSNFVRHFKQRFGITPSEYRRRPDARFDYQMVVLTT